MKPGELESRLLSRDGLFFEAFCHACCQATSLLRIWEESRRDRDEKNADEFLDFDDASLFEQLHNKLLAVMDEASDALFPEFTEMNQKMREEQKSSTFKIFNQETNS